jgi:hypothetical protein
MPGPRPTIRANGRWPFPKGNIEILVFKTVQSYLVELDGEAAFRPQLSEIEEARVGAGVVVS